MRVHSPRQPITLTSACMVLVAAVCTLGGCVQSQQQQRYNRHLSAIIEPAAPADRATLTATFGHEFAGDEARLAAMADRAPADSNDND